ncbi:MAG: TIGR01458 family HAD-type hydrolase [Opitutales bacterium]
MGSRITPRGILIDLDGVLYVGDEPITGAREALQMLKEQGLKRAFITNTTTKPAAEVHAKLARLGFAIGEAEVFSAVSATRAFLQQAGVTRVRLVVRESVRPEFAGFEETEDRPEAVVIGDIGAAWDYPLLNSVFRDLMDGARFVAMHRNKFFQTADGLAMDIGAFVAGLEHVSGVSATVVGKPAKPFFQSALAHLGLTPEETLIVGDDVETDVGGAQRAGLTGLLVRTGKFRDATLASSEVAPDAVLDSFADLPAWLDRRT